MRAEDWKELGARALARLQELSLRAGSRPRSRIQGFLAEAWQRFTAHRFRSAVALLVLAAALLVGLRAVPVVYGHYALRHSAGIAARQSRINGEEGTLLALRYRAFELGLTEAALDDEVFRLAPGLTEEGPVCTISYDFTHQVNLYGVLRIPVRIRAEVTGVQLDPLPGALAAELDEKEPRR